MKHQFRVNGRDVEVEAPPLARLLDVLREQLGLTGSKEGCGEGECGSCTVLLGDRAVCSCLIPVVQAGGQELTTVEGVAADDGTLHAIQAAFIKHGAAQCGICTPGFLMTALEVSRSEHRYYSRAELREALAGNLCRCTGYQKIIDAVAEALGVDE